MSFPVSKEIKAMFTTIKELRNQNRPADRSAEVVKVRRIDESTGNEEGIQRGEILGAVGLKGGAREICSYLTW